MGHPADGPRNVLDCRGTHGRGQAGLADPKPACGTWGTMPLRGPSLEFTSQGPWPPLPPAPRVANPGLEEDVEGTWHLVPALALAALLTLGLSRGSREDRPAFLTPPEIPAKAKADAGLALPHVVTTSHPCLGRARRLDLSLSPQHGVLVQLVPGCPLTGLFRKNPESHPHLLSPRLWALFQNWGGGTCCRPGRWAPC